MIHSWRSQFLNAHRVIFASFEVLNLDLDHGELKESGHVIDDGADDGGEDERVLQVRLLERVRDGEEPLDGHREGHEDRSHSPDVGEAVPEVRWLRHIFLGEWRMHVSPVRIYHAFFVLTSFVLEYYMYEWHIYVMPISSGWEESQLQKDLSSFWKNHVMTMPSRPRAKLGCIRRSQRISYLKYAQDDSSANLYLQVFHSHFHCFILYRDKLLIDHSKTIFAEYVKAELWRML